MSPSSRHFRNALKLRLPAVMQVSDDDELFLEELAEISGSYAPRLGFPLRLALQWKECCFYR